MYVYDFKFSDLSTIAYNHLLNHPEGAQVKPVLCDKLRRPATLVPLQSHSPGLHGGHHGRLRERVHHHAQLK